MSSVENVGSKSPTISKRTFWLIRLSVAISLALASTIITTFISVSLGFHHDGTIVQRFLNGIIVVCSVVPILAFTHILTERFLKQRGLSLSGRTHEILLPKKHLHLEELPPDETLELLSTRPSIASMVVLYTLVFLLPLGAVLTFGPLPTGLSRLVPLSLYGVILVISAFIIPLLYRAGAPSVRVKADRSGIWGHPIAEDTRPRLVPWPEIASCEIETVFDPFGSPTAIRPTFKNSSGKVLMTLNLSSVSADDQQRFLHHLKARVAKKPDALRNSYEASQEHYSMHGREGKGDWLPALQNALHVWEKLRGPGACPLFPGATQP